MATRRAPLGASPAHIKSRVKNALKSGEYQLENDDGREGDVSIVRVNVFRKEKRMCPIKISFQTCITQWTHCAFWVWILNILLETSGV